MYSLFFNHLDLPPAKVALMLFCQKLSRFIASKSWEKLQSFQFIPSKNVQKVQSFRFIFSKTLKNVTNFCNQLNLPPANVFFFGEREGKNHLDLSRAKIQKNAISESEIKNVACNHIHDLNSW